MNISIVPTTAMPGLQTHQVPETKERPGPDRDHDADDKAVSLRPAAIAPTGPGAILNTKA